jgi:predicted nucleotidyltransferase
MPALVERLTRALQPIAASKGVRLVYLFGSAAADRTRPESDIDVGILLRDDAASSEQEAEAAIEALRPLLTKAIGVAPDRLDLVCLNFLPVSVAFRVVRDGVRVYEADPRDHARYAGRVASEYQDFRYYEQAHARQAMREIREKGFAR